MIEQVVTRSRVSAPVELWRPQLARQVEHWNAAVDVLANLGAVAGPSGWEALDHYLGTELQATLREAVDGLRRQARLLQATLDAAGTVGELRSLQRALLGFRRRYLAVETVLDFYGDAINTRTDPRLGAYLRGCDHLAELSMRQLLEPLGHKTPQVLCYLDKGLGASILKAGLRLWDGTSKSPVAAIKIVRHNLQRPTSLIHETGHQAAHVVAWVDELAVALRHVSPSADLASLWSGWASEIAADAFAFVHTGYGALAALHDVLAGEASWVLTVDPGDPHPAGYLRVLLGRAMCRSFFGQGPWDDLADAWRRTYPFRSASPDLVHLLERSLPLLPQISEIVLEKRYAAFGGRSLVAILDPARVKPEALFALDREAGKALVHSSDWLGREALRLLALSSYRAAVEPSRTPEIVASQDEWMRRLGQQRGTA